MNALNLNNQIRNLAHNAARPSILWHIIDVHNSGSKSSTPDIIMKVQLHCSIHVWHVLICFVSSFRTHSRRLELVHIYSYYLGCFLPGKRLASWQHLLLHPGGCVKRLPINQMISLDPHILGSLFVLYSIYVPDRGNVWHGWLEITQSQYLSCICTYMIFFNVIHWPVATRRHTHNKPLWLFVVRVLVDLVISFC